MRTKRLAMLITMCVVGAMGIAVARFVYLWLAPIPVWHLPDVTKAQERVLTLPWERRVPFVRELGECTVRVQGEIDGRGELAVGFCERIFEIGPGNVDLMVFFPDRGYYNEPSCAVGYRPLDVSDGSLRVTVVIGDYRPAWANRPPVGSVPGDDMYWEIWYPDGHQVHSEGFYYQGRKSGDWSYYDLQGNLIRKETWEAGKLTEGEDVNPSATPTQGDGE